MADDENIAEKLSKQERRILKKQNKARHTLFRHDGLKTSHKPTPHLLIGNGGLDNGVERQHLEAAFGQYGQIIDITMQVKKPYAFVSYSDSIDSSKAMKMNGQRLLDTNIMLYLSFVDEVPGYEVPTRLLPPGLILLEDFVSEEKEEELLRGIDWDLRDENLVEAHNQCLKKRRVQHYGYEFLYSINNVNPQQPLKHGIPASCKSVCEELVDRGYFPRCPDQLTVNQYEPGQGIPPHVDTHSAFEGPIVSLSLGSQAVMDFHHPNGEHRPVLLPRRSLAIMTDQSRYLWTHAITPRKSDIVQVADSADDSKTKLTLQKRGTRTSFTFRLVKRNPCTCIYPEQCDSQQKKEKPLPKLESSGLGKKRAALPDTDEAAEELEKQHVHEVYEEIAGHFSDTRHTQWPQVAEFLSSLPGGAVVADIGCGNGKYLAGNKHLLKIGCDRSENLCSIAAARGFPVFVCDCLSVPLRPGSCDAVICIAVIHHLATETRRKSAVKQILNALVQGGLALIYVWALEQERNQQKSNYLKESKQKAKQDMMPNIDHLKVRSEDHGEHEIANCDVQPKESRSTVGESANSVNCDTGTIKGENSGETKKFNNIIKDSEQNDATSKKVLPDEKHLAVHVNRTQFESQDMLVPWHLRDNAGKKEPSLTSENSDSNESPVYHRYYHVFKEGELETLCLECGDIKIVRSYYDKGNWCVVLEKL